MTVTPFPGANPHRPDAPAPIDTSFDWDDPAYDPNKFYTSCRDSRDRITYRVNFDGGLCAAVTRWLQINQFPEYRNMNDFLRDSVRHRLEYLNNVHPRAARDDAMWKALDVYTRMAHLEARKQRSRANEEYVENLNTNCQEFLNREDWAELDGALGDAADGFDYLPEPFKSRAQDVIDKFRPYLNGRTW